MRKPLAIISAVMLALGVGAVLPAEAAVTLNADWNTGCGAATCFNHGVFTQTYSASDFDGPVTIAKLLMQRGVLGAMDSHTFNLSFTLGGRELGTWGDYRMGAIDGDQLGFSGDAFTWNPEDGDLVLVLTLIPGSGPTLDDLDWKLQTGWLNRQRGGGGNGGGGPTRRNIDQPKGGGQGDGGQGGDGQPGPGDAPPQLPITGPTFGPSGVPEPDVWSLMIGGFGLMGARLRRRRAVLAI